MDPNFGRFRGKFGRTPSNLAHIPSKSANDWPTTTSGCLFDFGRVRPISAEVRPYVFEVGPNSAEVGAKLGRLRSVCWGVEWWRMGGKRATGHNVMGVSNMGLRPMMAERLIKLPGTCPTDASRRVSSLHPDELRSCRTSVEKLLEVAQMLLREPTFARVAHAFDQYGQNVAEFAQNRQAAETGRNPAQTARNRPKLVKIDRFRSKSGRNWQKSAEHRPQICQILADAAHFGRNCR